jgi:hypothetical protein
MDSPTFRFTINPGPLAINPGPFAINPGSPLAEWNMSVRVQFTTPA